MSLKLSPSQPAFPRGVSRTFKILETHGLSLNSGRALLFVVFLECV